MTLIRKFCGTLEVGNDFETNERTSDTEQKGAGIEFRPLFVLVPGVEIELAGRVLTIKTVGSRPDSRVHFFDKPQRNEPKKWLTCGGLFCAVGMTSGGLWMIGNRLESIAVRRCGFCGQGTFVVAG